LRITFANARASSPVSTFWPGMVESGVPTMPSWARLSRTVLRPSTPVQMAPMPNAIINTPVTMPPYSRIFRMVTPFRPSDEVRSAVQPT